MTNWERISEHEWRATTAGLAVTIANGYIGGGDEYKVTCRRLGLEHRPSGTSKLLEAQAMAEVIIMETIADRIKAFANLKAGR